MKVSELQPFIIYDIDNNKFPNHIVYFINAAGVLYERDLIVRSAFISTLEYNKVIKLNFKEYRKDALS